jgi:hypothetical protein
MACNARSVARSSTASCREKLLIGQSWEGFNDFTSASSHAGFAEPSLQPSAPSAVEKGVGGNGFYL